MELDWITFVINLLGTGVVVGLITLVFDWHQNQAQRDFDARREAKNYYLPLYGHVAKIDEFVCSYRRSLENGKAKVFDFNTKTYSELAPQAILNNFKNHYVEFLKFYIEKKSDGYELFISKKMREKLLEFWFQAQEFYDKNDELENEQAVKAFHKISNDLTDIMEKLFGLNRRR